MSANLVEKRSDEPVMELKDYFRVLSKQRRAVAEAACFEVHTSGHTPTHSFSSK